MPRIFFAVHLTPEIKERLTTLQHRFPGNRGDIKWVEPHNLHLTLQFIGDVDQGRLQYILSRARQTAESGTAFSLKVCGTGVFPHPGRPRVFWAGVTDGNHELAALAGALSASLAVAPDKPFSPHITVGRVREGRQVHLQKFLQNEAHFYAGVMRVNRFACVQSTLTPQGPVYEDIRVFPLAEKKYN